MVNFQKVRQVFAVSVFGVTALTTTVGSPNESTPYCQRVRAEAQSRAALLFSPQIEIQALRVPRSGMTEGVVFVEREGFQARGVLAYQPLNAWRAHNLLHIADSECERKQAQDQVQALLLKGDAYGKLPALKKKVEVLTTGLGEVDSLMGEAVERFEKGASTRFDLDELHMRALRLQRHLLEARQEIRRLESLHSLAPAPPHLQEDLAAYESQTKEIERRLSNLRRLDAWNISLRAGVIPDDINAWYGALVLSYSLGGPWQGRAENRFLQSVDAEVAESNTHLRYRVEKLVEAIGGQIPDLHDELQLIRNELSLLAKRKTYLKRAETERTRHLLSLVQLDEIELKSHEVFLSHAIKETENIVETWSQYAQHNGD